MHITKIVPLTLFAALALGGCGEEPETVTENIKHTAESARVDALADASARRAKIADKAVAPKADPKPVREPAPEPEPEVDVDADLYVKRLVIAHGVDSHEPVDANDSFGSDNDRIYAFVEVGNRDRSNSEIYVSFVKDGADDNGGVRLRVGASPRWRTWAFTRLANDPGTYQAVVKNAKGHELARTTFEVTDEPA